MTRQKNKKKAHAMMTMKVLAHVDGAPHVWTMMSRGVTRIKPNVRIIKMINEME